MLHKINLLTNLSINEESEFSFSSEFWPEVLEDKVGSQAMSCAEVPFVERDLVAATTSSSSSSASSPNDNNLKFLE